MLASKHEASDQGAFPRGLAVEVYRLWGFCLQVLSLRPWGGIDGARLRWGHGR